MAYFDELLKDEKDYSHDLVLKIASTSVSVRYMDCLFEINVNSTEIAESVRLLYGLMIDGNDRQAQFVVKIRYGHFKESGRYIITRNGKYAYSFDNLTEAVPWFDWMLMSDIVDHHKDLTIIHASALSKDRRSIIFAGNSGCGKSTLAMMMCLNGWKFISDDVIFVGNGIHGIPRAFCLAEGLARHLFGNTSSFIKGTKREKNYLYINPRQLNLDINTEDAAASHIIFPQKKPKNNRIKDVPLSVAMYRLIENMFDVTSSFEEKLNNLIDSVENVSAAELTWNNPCTAVKEIERFVG